MYFLVKIGIYKDNMGNIDLKEVEKLCGVAELGDTSVLTITQCPVIQFILDKNNAVHGLKSPKTTLLLNNNILCFSVTL